MVFYRISAMLAAILVVLASPWAVTRQCPDQTVAPAAAEHQRAGAYQALLAVENGGTVLDFQRRVAERNPSEDDNEGRAASDAEVWGLSGLGAKVTSLRSPQEDAFLAVSPSIHGLRPAAAGIPEYVRVVGGNEAKPPPRRWRQLFHAGSNDPPGDASHWEGIELNLAALRQQQEMTPIERYRFQVRAVEEFKT